MNRFTLRSSVFALATALSLAPVFVGQASAAGNAASGTIATVNGKPIPASRADALVAAQTAQGQPNSPELQKMVRDELIRREVLSQESIKQGYEKNPQVLPQLMLARQSVLINAYIGDYVRKHPLSDDLLKKEYETIKLGLGDKEYKVRHILVDKEDDAKAIIAKLDKGEKFDDLAKDSKDPGSRERGGELGWAAPSNYVKPFSRCWRLTVPGGRTSRPLSCAGA